MQIELGTRLEGPPGPKYRAAFGFGEFEARGGLPKPSKLRDWRTADKRGAFTVSLIAPAELLFNEHSRPYHPSHRSVFDRLTSACEALDARYLLLDTGPRLSPSTRDRSRFYAYCETLMAAANCPQLVWRAGGLWETEDVVELCVERNIWPALDPFSDEIPQLNQLYLQLRAEGGTRRFGEDHFIRLIKKLEAADKTERVVIAIDSERSFKEAKRLQALLAEFGLPELSASRPSLSDA